MLRGRENICTGEGGHQVEKFEKRCSNQLMIW